MEKYVSLCDVDPGIYKHSHGNIFVMGCVPPGSLDAVLNFQLRDSDVLASSYPKTGQTWLQSILYLMDNADKLERGEVVEKQDRLAVPVVELKFPDGTYFYKIAAEMSDPRTLKTHLPLCYWKEALKKSPNTKVIQTIRNPKDTLVSLYHFSRMNKQLGWFHGTWDDFFETRAGENTVRGDLFQSTAEWYQYNKKRKNSLILIYEDMKKDLRGNVKKIATFLGKSFSDNVIDIITEKTTFENMSKDPNLNRKGNFPAFKEDRSTFMRKGKVGDWKEYFSESQNRIIDDKCKEYFEPIGLSFDYEG